MSDVTLTNAERSALAEPIQMMTWLGPEGGMVSMDVLCEAVEQIIGDRLRLVMADGE